MEKRSQTGCFSPLCGNPGSGPYLHPGARAGHTRAAMKRGGRETEREKRENEVGVSGRSHFLS